MKPVIIAPITVTPELVFKVDTIDAIVFRDAFPLLSPELWPSAIILQKTPTRSFTFHLCAIDPHANNGLPFARYACDTPKGRFYISMD